MFYKAAKIKIAEKEYMINIGHRLSGDLVVGLVAGLYLIVSILKKLDSMILTEKNIFIEIKNFDTPDTIVRFDGEMPEMMTKYINVQGSNISPNKVKSNVETKYFYWTLADVYEKKYILFQFETSDFVRGVIAIFNAFKLDVRDIMFSVPFLKPNDWKNVSLTIKNPEKDLLKYEGMESLIPYKPKTKYADYCTDTSQVIKERGLNVRPIDYEVVQSSE